MSEKPSCEELERRVRELEQIIASRSLDEDCQKWTEKILQERESLHRTILQTAMDGFWIADLQGKFLEVNDAYCRISGYSKSELLAMRISPFMCICPSWGTAMTKKCHCDKNLPDRH